jgi:hypothetical protein
VIEAYRLGFAFSFRCKFDIGQSIETICGMILKENASAFVLCEEEDLPFYQGDIGLIVFGTTPKKAYRLYEDLNGRDIRSVDPEIIATMIYGTGYVKGVSTLPLIYKLKVKEYIRKGEKEHDRNYSCDNFSYGTR